MTDTSTAVGDIMSRHVLFAKPDQGFTQVARLFSEMSIHHLPVVDDKQQLIGVISANDVMKAYSRRLDKLENKTASDIDEQLAVADLMTSQPVYVSPATSLQKAAELFTKHNIQCLPVVEGKTVKGIVTSRDLVRFFATQ
ncbi:MAG: CBS domain-containing protein [Bacteroidetes bacterium]|jgi:CBS domain-containing protein|nr:CBS domain-containing protein [Bacteroidota bacterium]